MSGRSLRPVDWTHGRVGEVEEEGVLFRLHVQVLMFRYFYVFMYEDLDLLLAETANSSPVAECLI